MLVPLDGALWLLDGVADDGGDGKPRLLVAADAEVLPTGEPILDPAISDDGSTVAFVCGNEVYAVPAKTTDDESAPDPVQVTAGARGSQHVTHGIADYLAQEEMDRYEGFWLSPDGTRVAFEEVDEADIRSYRIVHHLF